MLGDNIMEVSSEAKEYFNKIDHDSLPGHIAIIMDGNGRWAKERSLPRHFGHQEGMKRVIDVVSSCNKLKIEYLTLYAFSTENWKRPKLEVNSLMTLLIKFIKQELNLLIKENVRINTLGDISELPRLTRKEVEKAIEATKNNNGMVLNIALNYGGRDEIIYGIKELIKDYKIGDIEVEEINCEKFSQYLYTRNQPDPDLLIRPSGELRISNFLLYQLAYTEFWFSDILWPDFTEKNLYKAVLDFQNRNRRFGGL